MALRHWLQLSLTAGVGPILARRLVEMAGGVESACAADLTLLRQIEGIGQVKARQFRESFAAAADAAEIELAHAKDLGAHLICPDDAEYPTLLQSISDPPLVLYLKGTLEARDLNAVAMVGSRRCSFYGREQSERFGALLAGAGLTVISGGARGIDSAAHRGAMSHPLGRTIAVLGCGINVVYPPENSALFEQIEKRGAIISEYPIDTPPSAENFPRRNRIVSGMSRGVLVIEADERSGALITARLAGDDQGRSVFALPGRVDNKMSAGPHQLIRDGATLVTNLEEILQELGPLPHLASETGETKKSPEPDLSQPIIGLNDHQERILSHLDGEPITVDRLIELSDLDAAVVMRELTFLCLKGAARRTDGQMFAKTAGSTGR